jgi:hypothetical protein
MASMDYKLGTFKDDFVSVLNERDSLELQFE